MNNCHYSKFAIIFVSLILSFIPLKAFAGPHGLGRALVIVFGSIILAFFISTIIEIVLIVLWKKRQSGQRKVLSIVLLSYSMLYIPFITWLVLTMFFDFLYSQLLQAGISNVAILASSTILVIGLFLLKEVYTKRFKTVLWLSSAFVLVPVALLYICTACGGFFMGLSEYGVKRFIVNPLILAAIMLGGVIINAIISKNIKMVNILFITLLFLVTIPIGIKNEFAILAAVSVTVAWLLQRQTTKKWQQQ